MEPRSEVKKAVHLGVLVLGVFFAGMVTMAVGSYLLIANSGKIINLLLGGKSTPATPALPGLASVSQLMSQLAPAASVPGAGDTAGVSPAGLPGVSPDMMKQAMAMMNHGSSGQGIPDIGKMMAQLSPEARQLLMQMLQNPAQMSGLVPGQSSPSDPKN